MRPNETERRAHTGELQSPAGDVPAALAAAESAVAKDSWFAAAWVQVGCAQLALGLSSEAGVAFDRAFALGASSVELHVNRSVIAAHAGDWDAALAHARWATACEPASLDAQINAALIEAAALGGEIALLRLDAAVQWAPRNAALLRALAGTLLGLERLERALQIVDEAIAIEPAVPLGHELRLAALRALGRDADVAAFFAATPVDGLHPRLLVTAAALQLDAGQRDIAHRLLRLALARDPSLAAAWHNIAEAGAFDSEGRDIAAMEQLLERDAMPLPDRTLVHFALGKALEECGEHARAFAHFTRGNAARRARLRTYAVAEDERAMRAIQNAFPGPPTVRSRTGASASERPVFVVGMPRSGTSLVEQMLATHPDVFGAGELQALPQAAAQRRSMPAEAWPQLAAGYLEAAGARAGDALRVIDKLPLNFLHVGFIRLLFPNARIIHCRRDPVDRALSCYTTLFEAGNEFSYDLADLGRFTRAYLRLMAHWRAVVPADRLLELDYEALVRDPESQARRLLAFCGLPWDSSILRFHETRRAVRTASRLQVRRPIYRTSVGRAAAFGPALDEFRAALGGDADPRGRGPFAAPPPAAGCRR